MSAGGSISIPEIRPPFAGRHQSERIIRRFSVLVVESHEIMRRGLHAMLDALPFVADVRSAGSVSEARAMLTARRSDVIIAADFSDLARETLPSTDGRSPWTLLLIRSTDPGALAAAARHPADGFLMESEITMDALADALVSIAFGQTPMPAQFVGHLLTPARARDVIPSGPALTARERQVLHLLADGMTNKEIASELGISHHGVKRHVANVLAKMHAPNRTHAVARAINEGLLSVVD